jgi:O-antigen ligase
MSLLLALGLFGFWIFQSLILYRRVTLKPSIVNLPVLLFVLVNGISYIWGNVFRDPVIYLWSSFPVVQVAALIVNILLPLLMLMVANKINDERWLRMMTWIVIGIGGLWAAGALLGLSFLNPFYERGTGGLFATWVAALAFALVIYDKKLDWRLRGALALLVLAIVYRNFIQARLWLSGWLPIFAALGVILFLRSWKLCLVVVLAATVYVALDFDYYYQQVYVANADEGGLQRLDLWQKNLTHVANHPLLGMGPAGYAVYNMAYHPDDARSTHNNYFDILAQTGVVGFTVFLWLLGAVMVAGLKVYRSVSGRHDFVEAFTSAAVGGWAAAILAMMLGDWVIPFAYNGTIAAFDHASYTWLFAGGMLSLSHILRERAARAQPPGPLAEQEMGESDASALLRMRTG